MASGANQSDSKKSTGVGRGGKRPGAGRPKGSLSKRTREIAETAAATGITPLEYMLLVMQSSGDEARRLDAAKAAAPYMHPRLAAIEHTGPDGKPLQGAQPPSLTINIGQ